MFLRVLGFVANGTCRGVRQCSRVLEVCKKEGLSVVFE